MVITRTRNTTTVTRAHFRTRKWTVLYAIRRHGWTVRRGEGLRIRRRGSFVRCVRNRSRSCEKFGKTRTAASTIAGTGSSFDDAKYRKIKDFPIRATWQQRGLQVRDVERTRLYNVIVAMSANANITRDTDARTERSQPCARTLPDFTLRNSSPYRRKFTHCEIHRRFPITRSDAAGYYKIQIKVIYTFLDVVTRTHIRTS
jgi:hypothetical protein